VVTLSPLGLFGAGVQCR